jgi:hypothetical protein
LALSDLEIWRGDKRTDAEDEKEFSSSWGPQISIMNLVSSLTVGSGEGVGTEGSKITLCDSRVYQTSDWFRVNGKILKNRKKKKK